MAADGTANSRTAEQVGVSVPTVLEWRARFAAEGLAKFGQVRKGRGRKPVIPQAKIDEIIRLTQESKPQGQTHWSCRTMAKATGVSAATVQRVWSSRGLKPHLVETFKLSNDKRFDEKLVDVVGLYMGPPDKAVVLCLDEKSQIQALDRTQPGLPLKKGRAGTMTHDYKRNGTTTLVRRPDVLDGKVIGQCLPRHRNNEFLHFLKNLDRECPQDLTCTLILTTTPPGSMTTSRPGWPSTRVSTSFHTHEFLAQPGRTLVPQDHRKGHTPRGLQLSARPHSCHLRLPGRPQRRPEALRLDSQCRGHLEQGPPGAGCSPTTGNLIVRHYTR